MPKPRYKVLPHPSVAEIEAGLKRWTRRKPQCLIVERVGRSVSGRPILAAWVTDQSLPDDDKQHVLLTTTHAGCELNSCTGVLHLLRWLISNDPDATRLRSRYVVGVLPCCDPDGYEEINLDDPPGGYYKRAGPYLAWTPDGPANPEENPEAVALYEVMERFRPEAHVDVHGLWYQDATMWESTGISWSTALARSYEHRIPRLMDEFAERAGFLITRGDQDAGQVLASSTVPGAAHHYYIRRDAFNVVCFSYHRYHSLAFTLEAGFDESIVLRLRGLLEAGLRRWRYQWYRGLPVDHVAAWLSMQVAAWGTTAAQRRASRVELWQNLESCLCGGAYPEPRGSMAAVVAFGLTARERYLADLRLESVIARLAEEPRFDGRALADWAAHTPATRIDVSTPLGPHASAEEHERLAGSSARDHLPHQGLALRLLIPYRNCNLTHLRLDGHPLSPSSNEGYRITKGPGCVVQVNIPPGKVRDFHIVTCAYDPGVHRESGFEPQDWNQ